ncbi:BA14K family protein [Rhizobium oryzicola]|uniref:Lectin-like protein BA14k n=1 Tax=Rhizobium oryzicola TaxID=1232668 RepID=A0ABT8SU13_9HYPH|nr:BA14K family protein [Rhizobium oryzicola]MDO1581242.1 BA14K family protein [Rhizobium oryzicola]
MGIFTKKLAVLGTALAVTVAGLAPVQAMPLVPSAPASTDRTPVVNVQFSSEHGDNQPYYRQYNGPRRWYGRDSGWNRGWEGRHGGYYNGYRGYRHARPGYRYHNGAWFPLAAFAAGALIGGAVQSAPSRSYGGSHVAWCQQRYKTYRASDNTYVANSRGERRTCNGPY